MRSQLSSQVTKFFVRLDLNQSENHKITLRHNYVDAYRDILDGRTANNQLSFSTLTIELEMLLIQLSYK